ncbi:MULTISPECIES: NAD(P)/FAD-dependent oxidoreductase [Roseomonadaceae]|uniref:FAD-binding oxidoreductase n=1 Tax=Falsiroseomonas oleicola TaxID=2801474 RepID=A0ABS6HCJ3_9PROT|nr:FAD-binding oxidoreductase [Roseomonas oleicola]MBU8545378.1 FAD-binding oxidoreductase [Roseomonas oleicola]
MIQADVLIVGGGGAGTSAALHLARRGVRVVLLERGLVGGQATGVNYGGVRQQGRHPAGIPLARKSREIWSRIRELTGSDVEFDPSGHLKLARSAADEAELLRWNTLAVEHGLRPRMIGRNAIRELYPHFSDVVIAGSLMEEDGSANPRLLAPALARAARKAGADIREGHAVTGLEHDGTDFRLLANGTRFAAPWLLNCAGFWGGEIARQFGEAVPIEKLHPNMLVTEPLPYFLRESLGVVGGGLYMRQIARGNIIFGGGRGESDAGITFTRPRPDAAFEVMRSAIAVIPRLEHAMVIRSWSGTDGTFADHFPVLGPSRTTPGLIHAFGFCGEGFQTGPGVGAVLSELVMDGVTDVPLEAFDIGRFTAAQIAV